MCLQYARNAAPYSFTKEKGNSLKDVNDGCWALMSHPWWSRLWIIQEVLLAREVAIACGNTVVPWNTFRPLIQHLEVTGRGLPRKMALNLAMLRHGTKGFQKWSFQQEDIFAWLLSSTANDSECTDPRDRVYALLGLVENHDIVPDYSLSPCEVYCTAIRFIARAWHEDKLRKMIQPFPHVSLEGDEVLRSDCEGDHCGTWRCLLDIAQSERETDSILLKAGGDVGFPWDPQVFVVQSFLSDDGPWSPCALAPDVQHTGLISFVVIGLFLISLMPIFLVVISCALLAELITGGAPPPTSEVDSRQHLLHGPHKTNI
ncbi:hypothetical protein VPNG_10202 [Cytospora leucostoma]|uniref:Heterokaryon incompatibility domain-containing protein n=1 Tax=Cytospora leucostoma TaxID=1230097 RepID=A0A423VD71_9PEZI|nr:hypothetical protein VPNG_10202 [Cytospora leucostoma]